MRGAALVLLGLGLAVATVRYPPRLLAAGLAPLWLFLPALLAGLRATPGRAALLAWAFGLLADLLSLEPLGLHAFLFGGAALLLARLRGHLFSDHALTQGVIAFGLTFGVCLALLLRIEAAAPGFRLLVHLPSAFLSSAATGVLFPFLVVADRRVDLLRNLREGSRVRA